MTVRYKDKDYADPRIPLIDAEISKCMVAIVPCDPGAGLAMPGDAGSGTCITIGGRFFVATAAHVILEHERRSYAIASPTSTDFVPFLKGAGLRGGRQRDDVDIGWLELTPGHAKALGREFVPIQRIRTHCTGGGESLIVSGSPTRYQRRNRSSPGKPTVEVGAQCFPVRALGKKEDLGEEPDLARRIYLHWPRLVEENDGTFVEQPEAPGMSGGGVWALNVDQDNWSAKCVQLVGIEYSWEHRGVPDRFLRAYQIQLWLQMLADDVPVLRSDIAPFVEAGRFRLAPNG